MKELLRRVTLTVFVLAGLWLLNYVDTDSKFISFEYINLKTDKAADKRKSYSYEAYKTTSETIQNMSAKEYFKYRTEGSAFFSDKKELRKILQNLKKQASKKNFYFSKVTGLSKDTENTLLKKSNGWIRTEQNNWSDLLKYKVIRIKSDDFHLGSGLSIYPSPPYSLIRPHITTGIILIIAGFIFYTFSEKKSDPKAVTYIRWKIILTDIVFILSAAFFWSMPFLITGGALQIFDQSILLVLMFWPISIIFISGLLINSTYAAFRIVLAEESAELFRIFSSVKFNYSDIKEVTVNSSKMPAWLLFLITFGGLSGSPAQSFRLTGQALMLAGSGTQRLNIRLKEEVISFYITGQNGALLINNIEKLSEKILHSKNPEGNL